MKNIEISKLNIRTFHVSSHLKEWNKLYLIDCNKMVWGRTMNIVSVLVRNKNNVFWSQHCFQPCVVILYNINSLVLTGLKAKKKVWFKTSKYIGNLKKISLLQKNKIKYLFSCSISRSLPQNTSKWEYLKYIFFVSEDKLNLFLTENNLILQKQENVFPFNENVSCFFVKKPEKIYKQFKVIGERFFEIRRGEK